MRSRRDILAVSRAMLLRRVRAESGRELTRESMAPPSLPKGEGLWQAISNMRVMATAAMWRPMRRVGVICLLLLSLMVLMLCVESHHLQSWQPSHLLSSPRKRFSIR